MPTPPRPASAPAPAPGPAPRDHPSAVATGPACDGPACALHDAPAAGSSTAPPAGPIAPRWDVPTWGNLPAGATGPEVTDFEGKTVYLYCFQSWCPGCHSRGFPTLQRVREHYAGNDDVVFLAVQTVFEGFDTNRHELGVQTVTETFGLDIPVGHSGSPDEPSRLMRNYRTGGTPWTLIIGPDGVLHYSDFHIGAGQAIRLIDGLQP